MANRSKTFTPDGTWTPSGDMTLVGSALKLVAAPSYSDDFESYSIGATPTGWVAAAGSATVQSAGGQKVMRMPTGSSVRYSGTGYTDGLLEIQIVGNYGVYSYWTTRWDNNGTKRGVVFFSGVTGAAAGASAVIGPTAGGVGGILYPTLASGEQSGLAGSRKAVTYPAVEGLQVSTDANGDNQCWQYFNDVEFSRHINTAFRASGDQFGLTVNAGNHDVGYVKFWPLKTGGFTSPQFTPLSLTSWGKVSIAADLKYQINVRLSEILEYRIDAGAWTVVPDTGDLSAAPFGSSIQFRSVAVFKNDRMSNKDIAFYGLSLQIDGVWDAAGTAPSAPTGLTATAQSSSTVRLQWNDGANTTALMVFRGTTAVFSAATYVASVAAGVGEYTATGLAPATPYYFWLVPLNTALAGSETGPASATTLAATFVTVEPSAYDLGRDVLLWLVQSALRSDGSANFEDGEELLVANHVEGRYALVTAWRNDLPDDLGVVTATEESPESDFCPVKTGRVTVLLRARSSGANSGRTRVHACAQAIYEFVKDGYFKAKTNQVLPSGRRILMFTEPKIRPSGLDDSNRYEVTIEFSVMFRDVDTQ